MKEEIKLWNAEVEMAEHIGDKKDSDEINTFINKLRAKIPTLEASGITMTVEDDIENNGNDVIGYKVKINGEEIYIKIPQNTVKTEQGAKKAEIEEIINSYKIEIKNAQNAGTSPSKTEDDVLAEIKEIEGWEEVVRFDPVDTYVIKFLDDNTRIELPSSGKVDITFLFNGKSNTIKRGTTLGEWIASEKAKGNFEDIWKVTIGTSVYYYEADAEIEQM